jgi:hypothetical protein
MKAARKQSGVQTQVTPVAQRQSHLLAEPDLMRASHDFERRYDGASAQWPGERNCQQRGCSHGQHRDHPPGTVDDPKNGDCPIDFLVSF